MAHGAQDEVPSGGGHDPRETCPDPLWVETGIPDDRRAPLRRGHPLFALAAHAFRQQDRWPGEEHRGFWTALLVQWPRPAGPRPTRDRLGALAAYLHGRGVAVADIAAVVGVAVDTLRRRLFGPGGLIEAETTYSVDGERFRHPWFRGGGQGPLPRVYATSEQPPTLETHHPAVLDLAAPAPPQSVVRASSLAHEVAPHRRELVALGGGRAELVHRGDDGRALWRVPLLRVGDNPGYVSCPINERLEATFPARHLPCPA